MKRIALLLIWLGGMAHGQALPLPGAEVEARDATEAGSVRLPRAPWSRDRVPEIVEGAITREVLLLPETLRTTLQLITPLREALEADGYTEVFTCSDAACGGFEFRFQLDLIGEPEMHVDLGDFRYVLMEKPGADVHTISLVASRSRTDGFVHVTRVGEVVMPVDDPETEPVDEAAVEATPESLILSLTTNGRVVLGDLAFATGSAELGPGPFASLQELAGWLADNPSARVVLVGHTDAVGSLEANTGLSRRRAAAVMARLVELSIDPAQLQAAGAGFLAPLMSNLTEEGRAQNRRVEAVLLSVE